MTGKNIKLMDKKHEQRDKWKNRKKDRGVEEKKVIEEVKKAGIKT